MLFFLQLIILGSFGISYEFHSIISLSRDVVFFWGDSVNLVFFCVFCMFFQVIFWVFPLKASLASYSAVSPQHTSARLPN